MSLYRTLCILLAFLQPLQYPEKGTKPPSDSHFSILNIKIGKDSFQMVAKKLGPAKKCHAHYHDGVDITGYSNPYGTVVFEFGEIGEGDVTAFSLTIPSRTSECVLSQLPKDVSNLVTGGGVSLGMSKEQFIRVFGEPTTKMGAEHWKYEWTLESKYTEDEKKAAASSGHPVGDTYPVGIIVEANFKNARLVYFYISKLETT